MTCNEPFGFFVVPTVGILFLAKRHKIDDMAARTRCMETLRELFRQYMSLLILGAYFQIAVDVYTDLRYNADEWE